MVAVLKTRPVPILCERRIGHQRGPTFPSSSIACCANAVTRSTFKSRRFVAPCCGPTRPPLSGRHLSVSIECGNGEVQSPDSTARSNHTCNTSGRAQKNIHDFGRLRPCRVNRPTPKLRREMPLRRAKTGFRRPSHPRPRAKNAQISWGSTWPVGLERKLGWCRLEQRSKPGTNALCAALGVEAGTGGCDDTVCRRDISYLTARACHSLLRQ